MVGKQILHYEILEKLGEGGMGVVYKARDLSLDRLVALKFLPAQFSADEEERKRFIHEAKAASALDHPNICSVYEIGETPEGQLFIAMAHYAGKTLKEKIKAGPLPVPEAVEVTIQIAEGLKKAHGKGIVHRDIKPANVMLTDEGTAKIVDFGLAKLKGLTRLTKSGTTLGTVAYMSPEQAQGKEADQRSDVWALGVILYEMLTGRLPFQGEYDQAMIYAILNEEPEPVTGLRSGVPIALDSVIAKALAKDREERYQHADELLADLRRVNKETDPLKRESSKVREDGRRKLSPGLKIASWILLLGILAAAGYFLAREKKEPARSLGQGVAWKNSIAVMPLRDFSAGRDQEYLCDGMTDAIIGRLSRLGQLKVISLTSVMAYKHREQPVREIGRELGVRNILAGSVTREKDNIRVSVQLVNADEDSPIWSQVYDRAVTSVFALYDEISQAITEALKLEFAPADLARPVAGPSENLEAYEYYLKGMHYIKTRYVLTFREEDFKAGVDMFNRAIAIDPNYAMAYMGLSWAYEHRFQVFGDERDSREAQKASSIFQRLAPDSALSNALQGYMCYEYKRDFDKAFAYLRKALAINANTAEVNFLVGMCYMYAGLYEAGSYYLTRAVALDPNYIWAPYKLACSQMWEGEFEEAARNFEKYFALTPIEPLIWPGRYVALNIWLKRYGKADEILARGAARTPNAEWVRKYKAILLAEKGEREKALALYRNSEVYALLGMADEAFRELHKEIRGTEAIPYIYYSYLQHNPFYDNLRSDPRFYDLLARERKLHEEYMSKYGALQFKGRT